MSKEQYERWSRAVAFALKVVGVVGIMFLLGFWAITDRFNPTFLSFFGLLAGVGQGLDVYQAINTQTPPSIPPEDKP